MSNEVETVPCPLCLTPRALKYFDQPPMAWKVYQDGADCALCCVSCIGHRRVWAVGPDGVPWRCGHVGDIVPILPEGWGLSIETFMTNGGFARTAVETAGFEGMKEPLA